jgi:hypothetical protein
MNIFLYVTNGIIAIGTITAILFAVKSLIETQKTRKDSFMPILIPLGIGWASNSIRECGEISIKNCGRGPASDIRVAYSNGEIHNLIKFLDYQEYNKKNCILLWPNFDQIEPDITLVYNDIFGRTLKSYFHVTIENEPGGNKVLKYDQSDGIKFHLPC